MNELKLHVWCYLQHSGQYGMIDVKEYGHVHSELAALVGLAGLVGLYGLDGVVNLVGLAELYGLDDVVDLAELVELAHPVSSFNMNTGSTCAQWVWLNDHYKGASRWVR